MQAENRTDAEYAARMAHIAGIGRGGRSVWINDTKEAA